jgi:hypothetical protein
MALQIRKKTSIPIVVTVFGMVNSKAKRCHVNRLSLRSAKQEHALRASAGWWPVVPPPMLK